MTARPTSGDYAMVVIGGSSTDIGFPDSLGGLAPFAGCDMPIAKEITFVFDTISGTAVPDYQVANLAIGGSLVPLGVPTSSDPMDCMCWDSPSCNEPSACTIGGATTPRYQQGQCGSGATFDEPAAITAALTCP